MSVADPVIIDKEARRIAVLRSLALLDSVPEPEYDSIAALAAHVLDMPHAFIALMDSDRLWYKATHHFGAKETPRSSTLCNHVIADDDALVVDDLTQDRRFSDSPLVVHHPKVRFYAGMPIRVTTPDGDTLPIGTLCVLDYRPRTLSDASRKAMRHLADLAEALVNARATAQHAADVAALAEAQSRDMARQDMIFREAERMAKIGSWRLNLVDETVKWSEGVYLIHGRPIGEMPALTAALDHYPAPSRARVSDALARTIATGEAFDVEEDFITAKGELRRVRSRAERECVDGVPTALVGVFQDVTDRHALETQLRRSADSDELTGIANRAAFNRVLSDAITAAHRRKTPLLLALVDLDGFKEINDTLGHLAGDDVLRAVGRRLQLPWLQQSFAARLGGDEFALIVDDAGLVAAHATFAARLQQELCVPVSVHGLTIATSGTVGTALLGRHDNVRDFVHAADTELYAAKRTRIGERRRRDRRTAAA